MAGSGDQREWVIAPLPLNVEILPVAQRQERKVLPLRTPVRIPPGRPDWERRASANRCSSRGPRGVLGGPLIVQ